MLHLSGCSKSCDCSTLGPLSCMFSASKVAQMSGYVRYASHKIITKQYRSLITPVVPPPLYSHLQIMDRQQLRQEVVRHGESDERRQEFGRGTAELAVNHGVVKVRRAPQGEARLQLLPQHKLPHKSAPQTTTKILSLYRRTLR